MIFREAAHADLAAIIGLLANDVLGKARDFTVVDEAYERAFAAIDADPRNALVVADDEGEVVACMQVTYIPGLGGQPRRDEAHLVARRPALRSVGVGDVRAGRADNRGGDSSREGASELVELVPPVAVHVEPGRLR